jgi:uncharacterized RDD family membrane protein YckC
VSTASASATVPIGPGGPGTGLRVAGTDRRLGAWAVDRLIFWGTDAAVAVVAQHFLLHRGHVLVGVMLIAATALAVGGAFALMLGRTGLTPGRAVCGLRVVDVRTRQVIGARRALLRAVVVGGATVPFGFGLAALALTALGDPAHRRRGWHDRLVSSVVVEPRSLPVVEETADVSPSVVNLTAMRLVPARRTPAGADPAVLPVPPTVSGGTRVTAAPEARAAWALAFDTGERVRVDTIVLIGRLAQVAVAPDGTLVVTDRGSAHGSALTRRGFSRPLVPGHPATLLDGDVLLCGDRTVTVRRLC